MEQEFKQIKSPVALKSTPINQIQENIINFNELEILLEKELPQARPNSPKIVFDNKRFLNKINKKYVKKQLDI